jgi:hypothetical protein
MKYFDDIIPDIQKDCDKIAKAFDETVANAFYKRLKEEARNWYKSHSPATNMYKRTMQLLDRAPYLEKLSDYEYRVSLSPEKLWQHPWVHGKNTRIGSYESVDGDDMRNQVLIWEEEGRSPFAQYGYKKGEGIFGTAIYYFFEDIDGLEIRVPKISLPDEIKNDLITLMKKNLKTEIEKQYKDFL